MIITLTPNPSIDRTVSVPAIVLGEVNRASASRIDPGGKGVNVSRALAANGVDTVAVLPLGGPEGHLMADLLAEAGVRHQGVPVRGTLRMNLAIVEPDGSTTKVNEPGPPLGEADVEALLTAVEGYAAQATWVVGCGSLPPGADNGLLADLVLRARALGARVAIDTSGPPFAKAVSARPDLIKPNLEELEELVGRRLNSLGAVVAASRDLVAGGIHTVVVSLGRDGAILVEKDHIVHAIAHIEDPLSTVGAGDCLLAGLLRVLADGGDPKAALESGVRWGAAAVRLPGSDVPGPQALAGIEVAVTTEPDLAQPLADRLVALQE